MSDDYLLAPKEEYADASEENEADELANFAKVVSQAYCNGYRYGLITGAVGFFVISIVVLAVIFFLVPLLP